MDGDSSRQCPVASFGVVDVRPEGTATRKIAI